MMLSVAPSVPSPCDLSALRMVSRKDSTPSGTKCRGGAVEVTMMNCNSALKIERVDLLIGNF